jgi:hypothetical protein
MRATVWLKATGVATAEKAAGQEIGKEALTAAHVQALSDDLKSNPPQPFDIARALRVFSSKVQYVELEVDNYRFGSRQVQLPPDLLDITDESLKKRISGRIRAPDQVSGPFEITVETANGKEEVIKADEKWLRAERKRIEDKFTFPIPNTGRVVLHIEREAFDEEIKRFRKNLKAYHDAVVATMKEVKADMRKR